MDKVALLSLEERKELFSETAAQKNMSAAVVEKDFWVCWSLSKIFAHDELAKQLMFKGGTSLSKVFHLIERFSEDIDLILDWRIVSGEDPNDERSKSKQDKFNKATNKNTQVYIAGDLLTMVRSVISPVCSCVIAEDDSHVINIQYPAAFSDEYLRPEIRLEIGPLASWFPSDKYTIQPYAAEVFPDVFDHAGCQVKAIKAERTFWEKVTILHQEAHRPKGKVQPARYSRHYYDLAMMANSDVKDEALASMEQLANVVAFKMRFYPSGWSHYETAVPGTLKLIPTEHVLKTLKSDYIGMQNMFFGAYPPFDEMIQTLKGLEDEINNMS
ncbi:nucleotidyl transferase AbiEii/AbiGii toxin family protein [Ghiorsea bivora]|uniref:nucleotidyl transferase AbiEii/AbiGii toxin family protein n=1 Tax=Ghiorsea bivora TaxID=1485545 RepID=UPI0005711CFE|nr:nucleotidyl transferase AbiEii/AbiGii toxin family protein [Ghiorsea bivora]